jgi:hypothetical protein
MAKARGVAKKSSNTDLEAERKSARLEQLLLKLITYLLEWELVPICI